MTVFIPDSCWNIWRPQPTIRALRVGPWLRIRKITRPPKQQATTRQINIKTSCRLTSVRSSLFPRRHFTSSRPLLLLDAGSDHVVLLVDAPLPSDPAENLAGLGGPALLEEPAGALRQEDEADELQNRWDNGQAQHVPTARRERGGVKLTRRLSHCVVFALWQV